MDLGESNAVISSTLGPWVHFVRKGDEPDTVIWNILSPGDALRSEPGIMSGEPMAVLKAVAIDILLGDECELLSLTLLRSAIAGLEANEGSRMALDSILRRLQVRLFL